MNWEIPPQRCKCGGMMVDDLDSPSAGVSSFSSTRTLPVRNCPGKYRRFVLSKRIKNLTSFLVMLTVTNHKARADVTDSRSHSCPLRALTDWITSHGHRMPSRAFRQRRGWGASRRKYPIVGAIVDCLRISKNSQLTTIQQLMSIKNQLIDCLCFFQLTLPVYDHKDKIIICTLLS